MEGRSKLHNTTVTVTWQRANLRPKRWPHCAAGPLSTTIPAPSQPPGLRAVDIKEGLETVRLACHPGPQLSEAQNLSV